MQTPNLGRDTHFGTYRKAGFPAVDFAEFHRVELPRRLREGKSDAVAWGVEGAAPLALCLRDREGAYSFEFRGGGVEVVPGIEADAELAERPAKLFGGQLARAAGPAMEAIHQVVLPL